MVTYFLPRTICQHKIVNSCHASSINLGFGFPPNVCSTGDAIVGVEGGAAMISRNDMALRRSGAIKAPPPPYETTVYRRLWAIVAPYVDSSDLYAACLSCRQWHQVFSPYLWGNPAAKFGSDNDTVYCKHIHFS